MLPLSFFRLTRRSLALAALVAAGCACPLRADDVQRCDVFLQLPGIPGSSQDAAHQGEIVVRAFTYGVHTAGGPAANPSVFQITKDIDGASPELYQATFLGRRLPAATVTVRSSGAAPDSYLVRYRLNDVRIAALTQTVDRTHETQETLSLSFAQITMQYGAAGQSGTAAARPVPDAVAATPVAAPGTPEKLDTASPPGGRFTVTPDPSLKGRMGRLVVAFPPVAKTGEVHTMIYAASDPKTACAQTYGGGNFDLLPGKYTVVVANMAVPDVAIEPASVTRLAVGALRLKLGGDTRFFIYPASAPDASNEQTNGYGTHDVGLPAGSYRVVINGQSETVSVTDGQVTDF